MGAGKLRARDRYALVAQALHWVSAGLFLGMIVLGIAQGQLKTCSGSFCYFSGDAIQVLLAHKTIGVLVFLLVLVRICARLVLPAPAPIARLKSIEKAVSHAVHLLLYAMLILMPLTGYLMHSAQAGGIDVSILGVVVPLVPGVDEDWFPVFHTAHVWVMWLSLALVGLHIAGALKHEIFDRTPILYRMVPAMKAPNDDA